MSEEKKTSGLPQLHRAAEAAKISDLPVKEFMSEPEVLIDQNTKVFTAIQSLAAHQITGAPVVDRSGRLLGMISEYDLLMQAATKDLSANIEYTRLVTTVPPTATLRECLVLLFKKKIRRIPVIDAQRHVLGIVSRIDVLKRLIKPKSSQKRPQTS